LDLIRPALQQEMACDVEVQTVLGHYGFDALKTILEPKETEPRLLCTAIMGRQYAERISPGEVRLKSLTPIVKLTNGFSVTLFAKRGGPLKSWADVAAAKPLQVSTLQRPTATHLAELMMERKGNIATEVTMRDAIPDVVDDVMSGRSAAGIINTIYIAKQLDKLQPIVSFGAARNAMLGQTPTFAEVTGNSKLAFTESVGVFASPKISHSTAALLTDAFVTMGQDPDVIDRAEAANLPLAISGPNVLLAAIKRNERVLQRILG
jgi:tripartite-type tricarboxylate transporter receptor subunit TctC